MLICGQPVQKKSEQHFEIIHIDSDIEEQKSHFHIFVYFDESLDDSEKKN